MLVFAIMNRKCPETGLLPSRKSPAFLFSWIGNFKPFDNHYSVVQNQNQKAGFRASFRPAEGGFSYDRRPLFTIGPPRRGEDGEFEGCGGVSGVYEIAGRGAGCG